MDEVVVGKRYVVFYRSYKYEGVIVAETSTHFILQDIKEGRVHLPKQDCVMREVNGD